MVSKKKLPSREKRESKSRSLPRAALGLLLASAEQAGGLRAPEREDDVDDHLELPHPLGPVGGGVERDVAEGQEGRDVEGDGLLGEGVLGDAALQAPEHENAEAQPDEAREESGGREGVAERLHEVRELADAVLAPDSARVTNEGRVGQSRARDDAVAGAGAFGKTRVGVTISGIDFGNFADRGRAGKGEVRTRRGRWSWSPRTCRSTPASPYRR